MDYPFAVAVPILLGIAVVWLAYGRHYQNYIKEGDSHGANVTVVAMFGTFLPFLGFALIGAMVAEERRIHDTYADDDAQLEASADARISSVLNAVEAGQASKTPKLGEAQ